MTAGGGKGERLLCLCPSLPRIRLSQSSLLDSSPSKASHALEREASAFTPTTLLRAPNFKVPPSIAWYISGELHFSQFHISTSTELWLQFFYATRELKTYFCLVPTYLPRIGLLKFSCKQSEATSYDLF
jgi:hypothetical protein